MGFVSEEPHPGGLKIRENVETYPQSYFLPLLQYFETTVSRSWPIFPLGEVLLPCDSDQSFRQYEK